MKVISISRAARGLLPAYLFNGVVMAWECSLCGRLFSVPVEDAESAAVWPPPYIDDEFQMHSCQLQLSRELAEMR